MQKNIYLHIKISIFTIFSFSPKPGGGHIGFPWFQDFPPGISLRTFFCHWGHIQESKSVEFAFVAICWRSSDILTVLNWSNWFLNYTLVQKMVWDVVVPSPTYLQLLLEFIRGMYWRPHSSTLARTGFWGKCRRDQAVVHHLGRSRSLTLILKMMQSSLSKQWMSL